MLIISHNLLFKTDMDFPKHAVMRVNIAWQKNTKEVEQVLTYLKKHDIYLDYPQGRSKPPKPSITLDDAIRIAHKFPNVKYFAVSNVEDPKAIFEIRKRLPPHIELVPKIETVKGVENLEAIVKKINTKFIMLDKEDLYVDVDKDHNLYQNLVETVRKKCKSCKIDGLELQGVVFSPHKAIKVNGKAKNKK